MHNTQIYKSMTISVKFYIILFVSIEREILCQGAEMVDRFHRLLLVRTKGATIAPGRQPCRKTESELKHGKNRIDSLSAVSKFFSVPFCLYIVHQNYATPWIIAKQPTMPRNALFKRCTRVAGSFSILTFRLGRMGVLPVR